MVMAVVVRTRALVAGLLSNERSSGLSSSQRLAIAVRWATPIEPPIRSRKAMTGAVRKAGIRSWLSISMISAASTSDPFSGGIEE